MRSTWLGVLLLSVGCQLFIEASPEDLLEDSQERCLDQVDNDGDLVADCQDPDCAAFCFTCGDGFLNSPEQCDDGNNLDGDGCSAVCNFECVEDAATLCFLPGPVLALQSNPIALTSAQLNNDSDPDLAITTDADALELFFGDGAAFPASLVLPTGGAPLSLDTGDSNNDGATDIVVAAQGDDRLNVFFGDGLGAFPTRLDLVTQDAPSAVIFADLNNDGRADAITTCEGSGSLNSFLAQPGDAFSGASLVSSTQGPNSLAAASLNGDGFVDVVSANFIDRSLHVFLNNSVGGLDPSLIIPIDSTLEAVRLIDVNNDALPDAITASSDQLQVQVSLSDGAGGSLGQHNIPLAGTVFGHHTLLVQDTNNDNLLDLIVQTTGLQVQLFLGDGSGAFAPAASLGIDGNAITAGDFNGDGRLDVAVAEKGQPRVRLFLRQP